MKRRRYLFACTLVLGLFECLDGGPTAVSIFDAAPTEQSNRRTDASLRGLSPSQQVDKHHRPRAEPSSSREPLVGKPDSSTPAAFSIDPEKDAAPPLLPPIEIPPPPSIAPALSQQQQQFTPPPPQQQIITSQRRRNLQGNMLTDVAARQGDLVLLSRAIVLAELDTALSRSGPPGPFTLFAPNDEAFTEQDRFMRLLLTAPYKAHLRTLLLHHVVTGLQPVSSFVDGTALNTLIVPRDPINVAVDPDTGIISFSGSSENSFVESSIVQADVMADNGVLHKVDKLFLPAALTQNLLKRLEPLNGVTIFPTLVAQAGLESTIRYEEVTVFVPSDSSFLFLLPPSFLQNPDPDTIRRYVSHHVVPGVWFRERLYNGLELVTLWGQTVTISVGPGFFPEYSIDGALIDSLDIVASNGIGHILDGIMIPTETAAPVIPVTAAPVTPITRAPVASPPSGPTPDEFPWQFTPFVTSEPTTSPGGGSGPTTTGGSSSGGGGGAATDFPWQYTSFVTFAPTPSPTAAPTSWPTWSPTRSPTTSPGSGPSSGTGGGDAATYFPWQFTSFVTFAPTPSPTRLPTSWPTWSPTRSPMAAPTPDDEPFVCTVCLPGTVMTLPNRVIQLPAGIIQGTTEASCFLLDAGVRTSETMTKAICRQIQLLYGQQCGCFDAGSTPSSPTAPRPQPTRPSPVPPPPPTPPTRPTTPPTSVDVFICSLCGPGMELTLPSNFVELPPGVIQGSTQTSCFLLDAGVRFSDTITEAVCSQLRFLYGEQCGCAPEGVIPVPSPTGPTAPQPTGPSPTAPQPTRPSPLTLAPTRWESTPFTTFEPTSEPTASPTVLPWQFTPFITFAPTRSPTAAPTPPDDDLTPGDFVCSVCMPGFIMTLPNKVVQVPAGIVQDTTQSSCFLLDAGVRTSGTVTEAICQQIRLLYGQQCGCFDAGSTPSSPTAPRPPRPSLPQPTPPQPTPPTRPTMPSPVDAVCSVCAPGLEMTLPDRIVQVPVGVIQGSTQTSCFLLDAGVRISDTVTESICRQVQLLYGQQCGCASVVDETPSQRPVEPPPTPPSPTRPTSPSVPEPSPPTPTRPSPSTTPQPATPSPTKLPRPTFPDPSKPTPVRPTPGGVICSICLPGMEMTLPNTTVGTLEGIVNVTEEAPCSVVDVQVRNSGLVSEADCGRIFLFYGEKCGCVTPGAPSQAPVVTLQPTSPSSPSRPSAPVQPSPSVPTVPPVPLPPGEVVCSVCMPGMEMTLPDKLVASLVGVVEGFTEAPCSLVDLGLRNSGTVPEAACDQVHLVYGAQCGCVEGTVPPGGGTTGPPEGYPCSLCRPGTQLSLPDKIVPTPKSVVVGITEVSCALLNIAVVGHPEQLTEDTCTELRFFYEEECGCVPYNGPTSAPNAMPQCTICKPGQEVTNPSAVVAVPKGLIVTELSFATCDLLEIGLEKNFALIDPESCPSLREYYSTPCGCKEIGAEPGEPPPAPAPAGRPSSSAAGMGGNKMATGTLGSVLFATAIAALMLF